MPKTLQFRRDTTAGLASVTGAVGEIFIDTTKDTVVVMDGSTAGGFPLQRELVSNVSIKTVNGNSLLGSGDIVISGGGASYDQSLNTTDDVTFDSVTTNTLTDIVSRTETQRDVWYSTYFNPGQGSLDGYLTDFLTATDSQSILGSASYLYGPQPAVLSSLAYNGNTAEYDSLGLSPGDKYIILNTLNATQEYTNWVDTLAVGDTITGFYLVRVNIGTPGAIAVGSGEYYKPLRVSVTLSSVPAATTLGSPSSKIAKVSSIVAEQFTTFNDRFGVTYSVATVESGEANDTMELVEKTASFSTLFVGQTGDYATADLQLVSGEFTANGATLGNLYVTDNVITAIPSPDYYGTGFIENPVVVNSALDVLGAEDIVSTTFTNLTGPESGGVRTVAVLYPVADPGVSYLQIYLQGRFGTTLALNDATARSLENAVHSLKAGSTIDLVGYNGIWTGTATVTVSGNYPIQYTGNNGGSPYVTIPLVERSTGGSTTNYTVNDITFNVDSRTPSTVDTVTTFTNDVTFEKYITADRVTTDNMVTKVSSKSLYVISPSAEALRIELDKWDNYYLPSSDTITNLYFIMQPQDWATDGAYYPFFGFLNGGYKEVTIMYNGQLPTTHYWNDTTIGINWQNNTAPSETGRKLVTYRIYQGPLGGAGTWNPQIFGTYVDFA